MKGITMHTSNRPSLHASGSAAMANTGKSNSGLLLKLLGTAAIGIAALAFATGNARADDLSSKDKSFLSNAAEAGHTEIKASKIALEKNRSPAVKDFAETMVGDHTTVADELAKLAASKNVKLPDGPSTMQNAKIAILNKLDGATFDKQYTSIIGISAHEDAVKLFQDAAANAKDPDVKQFAAKNLPGLQHHLEMAKRLKTATDGEK
jgi:putative membrane protein